MSMDRPLEVERVDPTRGPTSDGILAVVRRELSFVFGTFRRASVRAGAVVALLTFVAYAAVYVRSLVQGELADLSLFAHVGLVVVVVGHALVTGAMGGLLLAAPWTAWKLAGAWILVPLVAVPLNLVLAIVVCSPLTSAAGDAVVAALVAAGRAHDWQVAALGPAARAGPVILVFALPLLVIDLGAIVLDPSVLLQLGLLVLAWAFTLLLGVVPGGLFSLAAVTIGYVRRLRS